MIKIASWLLVIVSLTLRATPMYAQGKLLTLRFTNTPIDTIFNKIEQQSGYHIARHDLCDFHASIEVVNQPIQLVLAQLLDQSPCMFDTISATVYNVFPRPITRQVKIFGLVYDEDNSPVEGVTVQTNSKDGGTDTDLNGAFETVYMDMGSRITFSHVNYQSQSIVILKSGRYDIKLYRKNKQEDSVVFVPEGFGIKDLKAYTGVTKLADIDAFPWAGFDDMDKVISDQTPGVLRSGGSLSMRGTNTLFGYKKPTIILDGFEYDGDINFINPNDIESIRILFDAAAAAVWGVRSGNGVIVITTKRAGKGSRPQMFMNHSVTIRSKPDIYKSTAFIPSPDLVDLQTDLFNEGYYDGLLSNTVNYPAVPLVAEILQRKRLGLITDTDADNQLANLKERDVRRDLDKYWFKKGRSQNYYVNVSGSEKYHQYSMSTAYENIASGFAGDVSSTLSLLLKNRFSWKKANLEFFFTVQYAATDQLNNYIGLPSPLNTYDSLVGDQGEPLSIIKDYRTEFVDSMSGTGLLDWRYRPLAERGSASNRLNQTLQLLHLGLEKKFGTRFVVSFDIRKQQQALESRDSKSPSTYFNRNLINQYSLFRNNTVHRQLSEGDIVTVGEAKGKMLQAGFKAQYFQPFKAFGRSHNLSLLAASQYKDQKMKERIQTTYGNRDGIPARTVVPDSNYLQLFGNKAAPGGEIDQRTTADNFFCLLLSADYVYEGRVAISGVVRQDASNIFGVRTNKKFVPLWAVSGSWDISSEKFYPLKQFLSLKAKFSYGYTGNLSKFIYAYTTAQLNEDNDYNDPTASLINPPNPNLRWEKTRMINAGLEMATPNNRHRLFAYYYTKRSTDLLAQNVIDPSTGVTSYYGNVGTMSSKGFEINIESILIRRKRFTWVTIFSMSQALDEFTGPGFNLFKAGDYTKDGIPAPIPGKPPYAVYSLPALGLNHQNGALIALYKGIPTDRLQDVMNSGDLVNDLVYNGPSRSTLYGFWKNSFRYRRFTIGVLLSYKGGYAFRKPSVNYGLLMNNMEQHTDYVNRWKTPGDEMRTSVPAFDPKEPGVANAYFLSSELLVTKADHLKLSQIDLAYTFKATKKNSTFQNISVYTNLSNIGMLWRANKWKMDPEAIDGLQQYRSLSIGFKITLQ